MSVGNESYMGYYLVPIFLTVAIARTSAYFGQGSGPIQIDSVQCTGIEPEIQNCTYSQANKCGHSSDVGVTCIG